MAKCSCDGSVDCGRGNGCGCVCTIDPPRQCWQFCEIHFGDGPARLVRLSHSEDPTRRTKLTPETTIRFCTRGLSAKAIAELLGAAFGKRLLRGYRLSQSTRTLNVTKEGTLTDVLQTLQRRAIKSEGHNKGEK